MSTDTSQSELRRLLYPIAEACELLGGIGRTTLYEEAKSGRIHFTKIGSRSFVSHDEIQSYLSSLMAGVSS
jgi:excisionase family DNA binding protein